MSGMHEINPLLPSIGQTPNVDSVPGPGLQADGFNQIGVQIRFSEREHRNINSSKAHL